MTDLTPRQKQVMGLILAYGRDHGRWPTYRALADLLGTCVNGANLHLRALAKKGYIRRVRSGKTQNIEVPGCEFRLWIEPSAIGEELAQLVRDVATLEEVE